MKKNQNQDGSSNTVNYVLQSTIKHDVNFEGIGLHSGETVHMTLSPAPVNTGIIFRRTDLKHIPQLKLCVEGMTEAIMCSKLVSGDESISTIEHLVSAICAFKIDNLYIDIDAPEVPVFDGSSQIFVQALESMSVIPQTQPRSYIRILKPISVKHDDKWVKLLPNNSNDNNLHFKITIDFSHPVIAATPQSVDFTLSKRGFITKVSNARTFGFAADLEKLHANNLAKGASLDNAIGLSEDAVLNESGLRYEDEFVRHKLLDAIGDVYTIGPVIGLYEAHKPSHALTHRCLKELLSKESEGAFERVFLEVE